ncbi:DUF1963 domain-containing protein [Phenylobacterium sp.]|uniref:DUF1963 domain-containing protein n=2 Tax=Phenylobacterium sp. TaxID=1871053 RepID=UPI0012293EA8|nr:MAG: DUF1963 domain-containing protein [Phenylobacterium sp.]
METAPRLVRELLAISLLGFAPAILMAAVVGGLTILFNLRGQTASNAGRVGEPLRSPEAIRIARRTRRNMQPSLLLSKGRRLGFSKLGGHPDLPSELTWPEGRDGQFRFLAQVDLADARTAGGPEWLPATGRIYAFHSEDNGSPDQVRVLYAPAEASVAEAQPRDASAWPYDEQPIAFVRHDSFPSLDWLAEDVAVDEAELDALVGLSTPDWNGPLHKLGGFPDELQDAPMAVVCERLFHGGGEDDDLEAAHKAARIWRLVLQIDSDPSLGTDFGGGRLYVFARRDDARRARFDRTITLMQT